MSGESGFQVEEQGPRYYEACVGRFMQPFVDALVGAAVRRGDAVLDVACGTGFATRAASERVGPEGRVVGSDINPHMLAMARSLPHGANVSWEQASALELPFDDGGFDTVICQQGAQFFPDTAAGLREMARVSSRVLAVTVWSPLPDSPYLAALSDMISDLGGTDAAAFAGAFRSHDEIAGWCEAAGLSAMSIEAVDAPVSLPPITGFLPDHLKTVPSGSSFFELDAAGQEEAVRFVDDKLQTYQTAEGLRVPFRSFLAISAAR